MDPYTRADAWITLTNLAEETPHQIDATHIGWLLRNDTALTLTPELDMEESHMNSCVHSQTKHSIWLCHELKLANHGGLYINPAPK